MIKEVKVGKEIERQWIIQSDEVSNWLSARDSEYIEQFYTLITENEEVRFRKKITAGTTKYIKTFKKGTGVTREEMESQVNKVDYEKFKEDMVKGSLIIKKRRYKITIDHFVYEFNEFIEPKFDHFILEIEFISMVEANRFKFSTQIEQLLKPLEITNDSRWKLKNVAKFGFPKINDECKNI